MARGCFTDRQDQPDLERAATALRGAAPLWEALVSELSSQTKTPPVWRFYGRNYGWALAFKKGGRALAALFPDAGQLTVLVVLTGEKADQAATDPGLSIETRELVASLPRFKEGCWVFLPVSAGDGLEEPRRLIALRAGAARRAG
jgi:hypothetical protein